MRGRIVDLVSRWRESIVDTAPLLKENVDLAFLWKKSVVDITPL